MPRDGPCLSPSGALGGDPELAEAPPVPRRGLAEGYERCATVARYGTRSARW